MILSKRPDVDRFLAGPGPEFRACVIYGKDRGGVRERADSLAKKLVKDPNDPFDVAVLTEADVDSEPGRLEGELTALSLMGGRRLVRLRLTGDKSAPDKAAAEALKAHADGALNPDAFFLVEAGALDRTSALRKAAESAKTAACIPVYDDETGDVARMVREALARDQLSLASDALETFVARLPRERGVARQEIERLALFLGPGSGRTATTADLAQHLGVEPEASLFDAAFDAFGARPGPAQAHLRRALAEGESAVMAVRAVSLHLNKLRRFNVLIAAGADAKEAAKACGVFWKQEREFLRQAKSWTSGDLDLLQPDVLDADRQCKTAGSPDGLLVERLLLSVAGRARRLGL
ncbi:DNA polymerase III subunit delta [Caulobacter sp. 17J80-11]|uniref:DNA polymerase III subunit delta n=1 Tax=Caulobacter sp. 17J80-11 TaxID=2763502 RepID=UPI00165390C8|nr:DNA polymerase III subunit delta [Caulobacter sp. 17J80-11]MBC6983363.1 DNA polymerase III subunit delta [Caulobacter sp. 17J80-11]